MSTSGRNWGRLAINGSTLSFMVDGKVAFEVPLTDVSQVGRGGGTGAPHLVGGRQWASVRGMAGMRAGAGAGNFNLILI